MALTPERQEENRRRIARWQELAAETAWFPGLGVAVRRGSVYQHGVDRPGGFSPALAGRERTAEAGMALLGPLTGAQAEAPRFNALAAAGLAAGGPGVAGELERLAALHSSGVLDDGEFRAAKARIIGGG